MIYYILTLIVWPVLYVLIHGRRRGGIKRIVVFQTTKIGDVVCTTPLFREIKKAYPDSYLGVVADPVPGNLLESDPHVDEVSHFDRIRYRGLGGRWKLAFELRSAGYDLAIILVPDPAFIFVSIWALIQERIVVRPDLSGLTLRLMSMFSTKVVEHKTGTLVMATYLRTVADMPPDEKMLRKELFWTKNAEDKAATFLAMHGLTRSKRLIGISASAGNVMKAWEVEKIARLVDRLLKDFNSDVILFGSDADRQRVREIKKAVRYDVADTCGEFLIQELPALIKELDMFIGVDTGTTYMADALDIPLVDIAGPADMGDQRPLGNNAVILKNKGLSCTPCSHTFSAPYRCKEGHLRCMRDVRVEDVLEIVSQRLIKPQGPEVTSH